MAKARKFVLAKNFIGEPKEEDLQMVEDDLPALQKDGKCSLLLFQNE
jgi:hypothetical protein